MQLNPAFPVVEAHFAMPCRWAMQLPSRFNRRMENGDLVLWRAGMTAWVTVWNNDADNSVAQRLEWLKSKQPPQAQQVAESQKNGVHFYSYCMQEEAEESDDDELENVHVLYGYALCAASHVDMVIYCETEADLAQAQTLFASLTNA